MNLSREPCKVVRRRWAKGWEEQGQSLSRWAGVLGTEVLFVGLCCYELQPLDWRLSVFFSDYFSMQMKSWDRF